MDEAGYLALYLLVYFTFHQSLDHRARYLSLEVSSVRPMSKLSDPKANEDLVQDAKLNCLLDASDPSLTPLQYFDLTLSLNSRLKMVNCVINVR